jgi:hypothetical protein
MCSNRARGVRPIERRGVQGVEKCQTRSDQPELAHRQAFADLAAAVVDLLGANRHPDGWILSHSSGTVIEQMFDTLTYDVLAEFEVALAAALEAEVDVTPDAEDAFVLRLMEQWSGEPTQLPHDLESRPADGRLAEVLCAFDPGELSESDRVRYVQASERLVAAFQARTLEAITTIHDAYRGLDFDSREDAFDGAVFELRGALRWTRRAAESEVDFATDLMTRLPSALEDLRCGRIDRPRAKVLVDGTAHLGVAHARLVAETVRETMPHLTTGQLRARVRRACLEVDPHSARQETARAKTQRSFTTQAEPDGTVSIHMYGVDAVRAQELSDRINRIARSLRGDGESRTMDQLRTDVAIDLLCGTASSKIGRVHFTIGLTDLFDPDVEAAADLAGYGPILHDIMDQVTEAVGWEWTVSGNSGMPVADGHGRRRHSASQRRRLRGWNPTCVAPGCRMPTVDCDLDHTTPYAEAGVTETGESAPLCRHDHCVRHSTGWTYTRRPDGDILWKGPLGTAYTASGRDP